MLIATSDPLDDLAANILTKQRGFWHPQTSRLHHLEFRETLPSTISVGTWGRQSELPQIVSLPWQFCLHTHLQSQATHLTRQSALSTFVTWNFSVERTTYYTSLGNKLRFMAVALEEPRSPTDQLAMRWIYPMAHSTPNWSDLSCLFFEANRWKKQNTGSSEPNREIQLQIEKIGIHIQYLTLSYYILIKTD